MKKEDLEFYKKKLLQMKMSILNGGLIKSGEDLKVSTDDLADEADLATNVINQQVSFNIRERELGKLRLIEEALQRIGGASLQGLSGYSGVVHEVLPGGLLGKVLIRGELWDFESALPVSKKDRVRVEKAVGMKVTIKPE